MQATAGLAGSSIEDLTEGVERWLLWEVALSECQQLLVGHLIAHRMILGEEGTATLEALRSASPSRGLMMYFAVLSEVASLRSTDWL